MKLTALMHKAGKLLLALYLLYFSTVLHAAGVIAKLEQLEEIRLTSFEQFSLGLQDLDKLKGTFTSEEKAYFLLLKGYEKTLSGEYERAFSYLEPLLQTEHHSLYHFRGKVLAVNLYALSNDYLNAFLLLGEINRQLPSVTNPVAKAQAVGNIALLYNGIEKHEIALFYAEQFLNSATESRLVCRILAHKLHSVLKLKQLEGFFAAIDDAVATCTEVNESIPKAHLLRDKMEALMMQRRYDDVIASYSTFSEELHTTTYPMVIAGVLLEVSTAYLQSENLPNAEKFAVQALSYVEGSSVNIAQVAAYKLLSQIEKYKGNYKASLTYFEKYSELEKKYQDEKTNQQLAFHLAEGELEVKNQRIALLDKDNELLSLQKNLYEHEVKQNRLIMLVLTSVLVLLSFLAYRGMSGRKRFKKIAEYDQLTGISNRYHFNNQAKVALEYCEKNAKPVAVILFDLDYFKNINDMHGHAAGDWALQQVVKTCRNFMRNNDVFGRIGGEEFAVVLPGCQTDKAVLLAEICRDAIAGIDSTDCGKQFPLSASFGVCGSDTSGYQLKQLLADADNAMYSAKEAGRDQVMAFSA
ncbi:GGDEF domain-containing protein [Rheinheimera sp. NSM]|uniref:GGDEF domain-containing protein n=1 Tax=Rheinheimera sp. NSM TaxID=3457884 RepID=UPI0040369445